MVFLPFYSILFPLPYASKSQGQLSDSTPHLFYWTGHLLSMNMFASGDPKVSSDFGEQKTSRSRDILLLENFGKPPD
jgi:hypothetical protein